MATHEITEIPRGGFTFDLVDRNEQFKKMGLKQPGAMKTGTTICGIIYKDGVILGADTRATSGSIVADKNCSKIHYIAPNIYCCGAGTAADTENTTNLISSQLALHRLRTERESRVASACRLLKQMLFKHQGQISAALVLGGVDSTGPALYSIHPHGSVDKLPFVTMGSGSLAAMAVFEDRFKPNMELEEGKRLVRDAIAAGVFNDLGSGSNIDITVITKTGVDVIRPYEIANVRPERQNAYIFKHGTTAVLTTSVVQIVSQVVAPTVVAQMETED